MKKRILAFASGSSKGGGSGFQELVEHSRIGMLDAEIVAVVTNHLNGGVAQKAEKLDVMCEVIGSYEADDYQVLLDEYKPDLVVLSGWLKQVLGLDPARTINIHPGPLPGFGGHGLYGHYVHEAVMKEYLAGKVFCSAVSMHFVTGRYDEGPVFFSYPVIIRPEDTPETLAERVNEKERAWQSYVTNLVVQGEISWDGKNPKSLKVPDWYKFAEIKPIYDGGRADGKLLGSPSMYVW